MAVLLIRAFYVAILNLSLRCSIFDYDTSWLPLIVTFTESTFVFGTSWQYFGL